MNNSFNVLPCLVPTNFTLWRWRHKMFSSSKIRYLFIIHCSSFTLRGELEAIREALCYFLFFFCSRVLHNIGFGWRTAPPKVFHRIFVSSKWCRKLFVDLKTVICLGSHYSKHMPLQSSVLVLLFSRKIQEKRSKKRKRKGLGAFYSVCRLVHYKAVGSWGQAGVRKLAGCEERDIFNNRAKLFQ